MRTAYAFALHYGVSNTCQLSSKKIILLDYARLNPPPTHNSSKPPLSVQVSCFNFITKSPALSVGMNI